MILLLHKNPGISKYVIDIRASKVRQHGHQGVKLFERKVLKPFVYFVLFYFWRNQN